MGWEVKIDMSGQSKDCLWVCNVKMKKFLQGRKRGTFLWIFGFRGRSIKRFENFSWDLGYPSVYLLWTYFGQYQLDLDGYNAHGWTSGLILHGAFQNKFLGILYHKLSTFMVIRRGAGSFKCHFWIFEILENFISRWMAPLWYYGEDIHLNFSVIN